MKVVKPDSLGLDSVVLENIRQYLNGKDYGKWIFYYPNGEIETKYLEYVKKAYMVEHYETCLNNSYLSGFYGEQYINQLYNTEQKPVILSFDKVADSILNITKAEFIKFIKKLLIFPNMKLAYQGRQKVEGLEKLVLNKIK